MQLLTAAQVASKLGCQPEHVRELRRRGKLRAVNVSAGSKQGRYVYEEHEVDRYINRNRQPNTNITLPSLYGKPRKPRKGLKDIER